MFSYAYTQAKDTIIVNYMTTCCWTGTSVVSICHVFPVATRLPPSCRRACAGAGSRWSYSRWPVASSGWPPSCEAVKTAIIVFEVHRFPCGTRVPNTTAEWTFISTSNPYRTSTGKYQKVRCAQYFQRMGSCHSSRQDFWLERPAYSLKSLKKLMVMEAFLDYGLERIPIDIWESPIEKVKTGRYYIV